MKKEDPLKNNLRHFESGGSRHKSRPCLPAARPTQCHFLQMAGEVRRHKEPSWDWG